jgi:hypothetical protein
MQLFVSTIQLFYYTFFNFFIQREGRSRLTHIMASFFVILLLILAIADLFLLSHILFNTVITFQPTPGTILLGFITICVLNYILTFNILNFEKTGNTVEGLFLIALNKYNLAVNIIKTIAFGLCLLIAIDVIQAYK